MLKTIKKRITVVLVVSMLLLLFAGVSPVLAEDSSDLIAEPEFVPMLAATLSSGGTTGATSAAVTDYVYGNLLVNVTEQEIATPQVGEVAPTAGSNLIVNYESGADITAGVVAGNYLQIYDVDMEEGAQIVAFYQTELTGEDIKEEGKTADTELMVALGYGYMDENGDIKFTGTKTVTKITSDTDTLNDGWYTVEGNINRNGTADKSGSITVSGSVHLILADSSLLTVNGANGRWDDAGIYVPKDSSLTIYAQSNRGKVGSLHATGGNHRAGIGGGTGGSAGNITINGGIVTAAGGLWSAGIGGGVQGSRGNITINGGRVTATGGHSAAGIGGGFWGYGGEIIINGGIITATGGHSAAGIGGGAKCSGGNITINGGNIMAIGGRNGAGIGGGAEGYYGEIIINDDTARINAFGDDFGHYAEDIGNGRYGKGATIIRCGDANGIDLTDPGLEVVAGFGHALNFSASSQSRINVPFKRTKLDEYNNDDTKISGNSDFTISMWIFPKENEPYQTLYRQEGDTIGHLGLDFRFIKFNDDEGYLYFGFNKLNSGWQNAFPWNDEISLANITKIPMNQWTHVALTKSGKSIILYANGIKYYEMTLDDMHYNAPAPLNGDISFGGTTAENQFFNGRMDEIQFWNTALTPAEIKAWMYRGADGSHKKYSNLVYYYKLNQDSGTTVIDSKGSYDGTTVNMPDSNWIVSDVKEWTVDAGSILNGELVGSYAGGSSNDGTDWNLTFEIVEQAKKGTATITGDNEFEYCTKDTKQINRDSFTYRVKDPNGRYSNTYTVNIDIIPILSAGNGNSFGSPSNSQSTNNANGKSETADAATTTQEGDKTITAIVVNDKKVEKILEQEGNHAVVTISVMSGADVVIGAINGQTVKNMASKDAVLEIKTGQVTYTLPASQINIDAVSEQIGKQVELKDIAVSVKISEPAADTVKIIEDTADKNNYQIVVKPIEFEITCSSGSKTVAVSKFSAYVERIIAIPEGVDPSKITTGVILNSDGTFSHVPTVITMIDGKYYAKINSLTNSAYLLIYSPKTFQDVKNHWAQKDIYDMASRLIISGVGNDLFESERSITRAEFSAVMVRALGLRAEEYKNDFFDVKAGEWYSEYISTLSSYGLVRGYDDGIFKPDGNITRQEAMAILARAMETTKLGEELEIDASHILAAFNDNADVSGWAKDSVSKCVKTGVVTGRDNSRIAPLDNITRAETTIMVRRLLLNSGLINK